MKTLLVSLSLLISVVAFGQNNTEQTKIKNYLESTIQNKSELLVSSALQNVLASDIIKSELTFSAGEKYGGYNTLQIHYFIKTGKKLLPFKDLNALLASSEFIESIKTKKFKLTTEEDGVAFQTMLKQLDNERGLGYFTEENTWYFIRSKFFDDIKAYIVTTDKKGQITSVVYQDELKKTLPETLLQSGNTTRNTADAATISKKDSVYMRNYLFDKTNYEFEISPLDFYSINKISTILLNKCNLKVTEGEAGNSFTNNMPFLLISSNNEYIKSSIDNLLETPLFLNSLQEKYTLKTEDDARLFQYVLDDLSPVSKFDIELKTFYKKDNMWFFVREKRFDDLKGYILLVDDKNKVSYMEYATISEESILGIKMKDPNFKVDYKFKLIQPTTNKIKVKQGEGVLVEISFDEDAVHAAGCWILSHRDGKMSRTYGGNSIKSPYAFEIPSEALENQYHTYEYFLLKNETKDPKDALKVIKIEIEVE